MNRLHALVAGLTIFLAAGFALPYFMEFEEDDDSNASDNITLVVTKNYGRSILGLTEFHPSTGLTAMEMLRSFTDIETRYGGLYVFSAYGLRSDISKRLDWFYYVNGVYMDRGLASYKPRAGEVVQVDYHYWGSYAASPGFLSGFPARFIYGLGGRRGNISLVAPQKFQKLAAKLSKSLSSICGCECTIVESSAAVADDLESNVVVLADPDDYSFFTQLWALRKHIYWPAAFEDGKLWLNGLSKGHRTELTEGYAIQSTDLPGKRWGVLLLATDGKWMTDAVTEVGKGISFGYRAAIAVGPVGTIPLPVE